MYNSCETSWFKSTISSMEGGRGWGSGDPRTGQDFSSLPQASVNEDLPIFHNAPVTVGLVVQSLTLTLFFVMTSGLPPLSQ